jgi:hypothetical protein
LKKLLVILALAAVLAVAVPVAVSADGVSADIPLKAGWNMVSVPLVPDNPAADVVFAGAEAVYWWDPATKSYVYNPPIDPCKGYWVAAIEPMTVTVTGEPYTG